jgi:hypothetical protein
LRTSYAQADNPPVRLICRDFHAPLAAPVDRKGARRIAAFMFRLSIENAPAGPYHSARSSLERKG